MDFRCFDFGKRTEIMVFRLRKRGNENGLQLRKVKWNAGRNYDPDFGRKVPDIWMKRTGSGRLDNGNRNEPVLDVRMMETTSSGRLDNGNQNELVFTSFYFSIRH
ncbi:uncharacterized protein OCT59_002750 [Rhizophagus irregularis]|uniref:uncharacterized protein n=1 Tax=Rhizophagus irregularis TaxID=588596 RepID=UPI003319384C|nr:hypothetical protein OCT59_002750 [Rhizophagus irregularis]